MVTVGARQSVWVQPLTVYACPAAVHSLYPIVVPVYPVPVSHVTPDGAVKLPYVIVPPVTELVLYPAVDGVIQSVRVHPLTLYGVPTAVHAA